MTEVNAVLKRRHPHSRRTYGCQLQITTIHAFGIDLYFPTGNISVYVHETTKR